MDHNFNRLRLCGQVASSPAVSHVNHGMSFYKFQLSVDRLSGQADVLTVIASEALLQQSPIRVGDFVTIEGQLRSFNNKSGVGHRLIISVFARSLTLGGHLPFNQIQLSGILCKTPTLRHTPLGREICDIILAVNRRYGRADYLPCIAHRHIGHLLGHHAPGNAGQVIGPPVTAIDRQNNVADLPP